MRVVPLGVRESTPAPGAAFVRYGGHTGCLAVLTDAGAPPSLLLDAGTGLRELTRLLGGEPFRGSIVLTHLHWDHVQGLPFCPSVDLARAMSPPHFPIGPEGLLGRWRFHPARPGVLPICMAGPKVSPEPDRTRVGVRVAPVPHKGGVAFGVRVERPGATFAYLPDHAPSDDGASAETLAAGVDVLFHDGQFGRGEEGTTRAYGHSTIEEAMVLADRCGAGRLVVVHHHPCRSDGDLDGLAAAITTTPGGRPVSFAVQGVPIDVIAERA